MSTGISNGISNGIRPISALIFMMHPGIGTCHSYSVVDALSPSPVEIVQLNNTL